MWDKRWFQFTILLILAFVWGSSFILIKIGIKSFSSDQAAAIRMMLASLALLPISIRNLKKLKRKDLPALLFAGFIGSFIPAFLFTKAQTQIDSALAGILNSLTPVFTLIVGVILFKAKFKVLQIFGLILGLVGASGLIIAGQDVNLGSINLYALFIVLATTFYALNINIIKAYLTHLNGMQITSLSFMFLWPVALIYLLTTDFEPVFQNPQWPVHFAALATLGVLGTAVAMLLMNSLIRHVSTILASSVTYIIPIFAIMWGIVDGEKITLHHMGNMLIILAGVYLINRRK
ncbi:MAG: DMT family transporter [Cyclobacteriaceae bacterium]|nr:DMT family transporter [Cyclobacteriaceae bacterium]